MLFDSVEMRSIRQKFENVALLNTPEVIKLDRLQELRGEREYLEFLIQTTPENIQRKWLGDFISTNNGQHLGAWFEMMLYGWLRSIGEVDIEPKVEGDLPDFSLYIEQQKIYIEAKAILEPNKEKEERELALGLPSLLAEIDRKYFISVLVDRLNNNFSDADFLIQTINWLDNKPEHKFVYQDEYGNRLVLSASSNPHLQKVKAVVGGMFYANPSPLQEPIRNKAKQHKKLRQAGLPYVIALYLESFVYSAEEVVIALFGNQQFTIDFESGDTLDSLIDKSGMHFFGQDILHKSVSGTLVFKANFDEVQQRHKLQAWYIENPYANLNISTTIFPVEAIFGKLEANSSCIKMGWYKKNS